MLTHPYPGRTFWKAVITPVCRGPVAPLSVIQAIRGFLALWSFSCPSLGYSLGHRQKELQGRPGPLLASAAGQGVSEWEVDPVLSQNPGPLRPHSQPKQSLPLAHLCPRPAGSGLSGGLQAGQGPGCVWGFSHLISRLSGLPKPPPQSLWVALPPPLPVPGPPSVKGPSPSHARLPQP